MSKDGLFILTKDYGFAMPLASEKVAAFSTRHDAETAARAFGVHHLCEVVKYADRN